MPNMNIKSIITLLVLSCFFGSNGIAPGYSWSYSLASGSSFCPMPAQINAKVQGYLNIGANNPCPDSAQVILEWGDGTSDTLNLEFTGSSYYCYFVALDTHTYVVPGRYQIRSTIVNPVYQNNVKFSPSFKIAPECIEIDGVAFKDQNSNCFLDTSEDRVSRMKLMFYDSTNTFIGAGFTDSSGFFEVTMPSGSE